MKAIDSIDKNGKVYRTGDLISVGDFLNLLFEVDKKLEEEFKDYCVSFSHFICLDERISQITDSRTFLEKLMFRGTAAVFADSHPGADFVIPMIHTKTQHMSAIFVQVKTSTTTRKSNSGFLFENLRPSFIGKDLKKIDGFLKSYKIPCFSLKTANNYLGIFMMDLFFKTDSTLPKTLIMFAMIRMAILCIGFIFKIIKSLVFGPKNQMCEKKYSLC